MWYGKNQSEDVGEATRRKCTSFIGECKANIRAQRVLSRLRLHVERAPEIPAGDGRILRPGASDPGDLFRLRVLALLVVIADGGLHAEVAAGEHVLTAEGDHEEHLRRPLAD